MGGLGDMALAPCVRFRDTKKGKNRKSRRSTGRRGKEEIGKCETSCFKSAVWR